MRSEWEIEREGKVSGRSRRRPWWRECEELGHIAAFRMDCLGCAREADLRLMEIVARFLLRAELRRKRLWREIDLGMPDFGAPPLEERAQLEKQEKWWLN